MSSELEKQLKLALSRAKRLKNARDEAERLLEQKSRELYAANTELEKARDSLEDDIQQATYELSVSNQRLQKALNERSTFIGQMSHEVRTPLNAIIGLSEILLSTKMDDVQLDYMNTINSAASSLVVLLNDMLDITKIEAGKLKLNLEEVNSHKIHKSAVSMFELEASEKGVRLDLEISEDVPDVLMLDKGRYKQIINNLVSNAVKNTESGSVMVKVAYTPDAHAKHIGNLNVQVIDTGIGIPKSQMQNIFNAYEQLGITSKGVGLGLAICSQLCELMQGSISCESEVGNGSVFELNIPAECVAMNTVQDEGFRETRQKSLNRIDILVAEDNVTNQKVLTAQLAQLGQEATIVNNGAEAIACLRDNSYDVVFLDILMPVMDGEETLKTIRNSSSRIAEHYCVALTASSYQDQRERLLNLGFDEFLSKPLSIADLSKTLENIPRPDSVNEGVSEKSPPHTEAALNAVESSFDYNYLRSQFGDACEAIFVDIAPTFLEHTGGDLSRLKAAVADGQVDSITKISHSMKGGSASMGLHQLADRLEKVERNSDSVEVHDWYEEIETLWATAAVQIENELTRLRAASSR